LLIGARGAAALMPLILREQKFFGSFFQKRTACFLSPGEARMWVNHKGGWYNYVSWENSRHGLIKPSQTAHQVAKFCGSSFKKERFLT
jgi:hypothetical protein